MAQFPFGRKAFEAEHRDKVGLFAEGNQDWNGLIPSCFQVESHSLVCRASGFVARQSQITVDLLLPRASPPARHPAGLNLNLKATWNKKVDSTANPRLSTERSGGL